MNPLRALFTGVVLATAAALSGAHAQSVEDFYRGKTVNIIVGYAPGGGYDLYARILSRYIGNHIPGNPTITVQNMPGAASLRAANHIYAAANKDGTVFGTFDMNMPLIGFVGDKNVLFDARKFTWLGSLSNFEADAYVLWARKTAAAGTSAALMKADGPPLNVGVAGAGASDYDLAVLLRETYGMRLRLVPGYPSSSATGKALEGGEVDGQFVTYLSSSQIKPAWGKPDNDLHVILQFGRTTRHPNLQHVPLVREMARNEQERRLIEVAEAPYKLSRPYVGPPGIPEGRAKALQAAFAAAAKTPGLIAEAQGMNLEISPVLSAEAASLIDALSKSPPEIFAKLRQFRESGPQ